MQMPNISPSICLSDFKKKKKWLKLCIASIFLYEKSVKKSISKKKRTAEEGLKKTFRRLWTWRRLVTWREILTLSNKISDFYLHVFFPLQFHTVKLDLNNPFHLGNHMELGNWVRIVTWDDDVWLWSKLILYSGETWHDGKRSRSSSTETGLTVCKFIFLTLKKVSSSWTFHRISVGKM